MSEFKVGDKVKTNVSYYRFPAGTIGKITKVWPSGSIDIKAAGSDEALYYSDSAVEKVDAEPTIDLTDLDAEALEKVKEFADSLRKQAPPTEENKYIWLPMVGGAEVLAIRCSDGEYVHIPGGWNHADYIHSNQITKWRPAEVK